MVALAMFHKTRQRSRYLVPPVMGTTRVESSVSVVVVLRASSADLMTGVNWLLPAVAAMTGPSAFHVRVTLAPACGRGGSMRRENTCCRM
jgi:hypothetical protein